MPPGAFALPAGDFRGTLDTQPHQHDVTQAKKITRRRRTRGKPKPSRARRTAPPVEAAPDPPVAAPLEVAAEPPEFELPLTLPEAAFAARAAAWPPEPERPFPTTRRAIFFDVENTSRAQHIARVIDYLAVDRLGRRTDFVAVGNWRVIGHDTARLLAGHGAQLMHSAPSVGVKDWSDLRIAVAAGVWLGTARPGDILEIISDDRAFDAVGDVAVGLGIAFRRMSYRTLTGVPREQQPVATVVAAEPRVESHAGGGRRRRGRRGGYGGGRREAPIAHAAPPPVVRPVTEAEPHTAPHDELLGVARDLISVAPSRTVTLDTLANALKSRGFSRTPGSPRLITRLRRIRELSVSRSGHITLVDSQAPAEPHVDVEPDAEPVVSAPPAPPPAPVRDDEDDDRGNRLGVRSLDERRREVEAAQALGHDDPPQPAVVEGNRTDGPQDEGFRRRRSRRGGRRHRRHSAPAAG